MKKYIDDYCYVEMPNEGYDILNYNHQEKSLKAPAVIYADLGKFRGKFTLGNLEKMLIVFVI